MSLCGVKTVEGQYYSNTMPNLPNFDEAWYNFGFYVGANQMLFTVKSVGGFQYNTFYGKAISDLDADSARLMSINGKPGLGFNVGLVSLVRMGKYFELRFVPGLQFGERMVDFTVQNYLNGAENITKINKRVISTYINVPFHFRYKAARIHNFRPYIYAGPNFKWDLSSLRKKEDNARDIRLKMSGTDFSVDVGVGFDIYTNWFKFGIEIEMSYGIKDILVHQDNIYTSSIEKLRSKIFQINFTFE